MQEASLDPSASHLTLRSEITRIREERPTLRARDIARTLGIPEGTLVAAGCGQSAQRLDGNFAAQFESLGILGEVMALTRNEHAVIERVGRYEGFRDFGHASQIVGPAIDLRLFLNRFAVGFAVTEEGPKGTSRSIQYFDAHGEAIHKVHLRPESDLAGFKIFCEGFASPNRNPEQTFAKGPAPEVERPDREVDAEGLRRAVSQLQDTHDFFGILRAFGVTRTQALRLLGDQFARRVENKSLRPLLERAVLGKLPIMLFVGSRGVIQIYSGAVERLLQVGDWFNVMDPGFNLHLHETGIAAAYVVRKPTRTGFISSLELFDAAGQVLLMAFAKRSHDDPEPEVWRGLLNELADRPGLAESAT